MNMNPPQGIGADGLILEEKAPGSYGDFLWELSMVIACPDEVHLP